jgi:zinc and cadmium transporter
MTLVYIIAACLVGSTLSALLAAMVAWRIQPRLIPMFVSYAVGALLGVVFLDLLPHIFEHGSGGKAGAGWILTGILAFFVMEKMVLWRHDHHHGAEVVSLPAAHDHSHPHAHSHDSARRSSAWMIIIGDGFHNFTDGLAIAAAFMADIRLGVVTALAIIAHELPQELGDFLILIHSGFSRMRALFWNLVSSLATLIGAILAYVALSYLHDYASVFLCFAASSMIYVAIADLIPGLHRRTGLADSIQQIALITLGIGSIWIVRMLIGH